MLYKGSDENVHQYVEVFLTLEICRREMQTDAASSSVLGSVLNNQRICAISVSMFHTPFFDHF